jgi:hypothetical protein
MLQSEEFHAKALKICSRFLPSECQLGSHIVESFIKHHLKPKVKKRNKRIENVIAEFKQISTVTAPRWK